VARFLEKENCGRDWLGEQLTQDYGIGDGKQVVNRLLSRGEVLLRDLAAMLYELGYELKLSARKINDKQGEIK